jgi:hypothetical protein
MHRVGRCIALVKTRPFMVISRSLESGTSETSRRARRKTDLRVTPPVNGEIRRERESARTVTR